MSKPVRWNIDKPHRCPECHSVAVAGDTPKSWRVYACCRCSTRFTRWPRIAWLLPFRADSCDCNTVWEDDPDSRHNLVTYGGWCAPSPSHCRECGHEICVCYTRPPRPQCVGDCEPECVGMCFLEVTDD